MSLDNEFEETKGGILTAVYVGHTNGVLDPLPPHVYTASRCIIEGAHRLATEDEIAQNQAKEDARREQLKKEEQAKKLTINNTMSFPPELMAAFMQWQGSQQVPDDAVEKPKKSKSEGK